MKIKYPKLFANGVLGLLFGALLLAFYFRFKNEPNVETFFDPELWESALLFLGVFIGGLGLAAMVLSFFTIARNLK